LQELYTKGAQITITPQTQPVDFDIVGHFDDVETDIEVKCKVAVALAPDLDLATFLPYVNKIVDGTKILYDGVVDIGRSLRDRGKSFLLHPANLSDSDVSQDFYMPMAVCTSPFDVKYDNTTIRVIEAEFTGYVDNLTSKRKFQIGDRTASADIVAPTVSSTVPVDNADTIAKASGLNIDFVMSEDINPATAVKGNTVIQTVTGSTLFTNYTVLYISASKTIRITTGAALEASTEYLVTLTTGVKDLSGNALAAPNQLTFTTGL
jgi:hypothetical protein